jgi:hypothetical protein
VPPESACEAITTEKPPDFTRYKAVSLRVCEIFSRHTELHRTSFIG